MNDELVQLISRANIVSPSPVAIDLLRLLCDRRYSRARFVKLVRQDPATSTALLRAASMTSVSRSRSSIDIDEAVARLGAKRVRRIVVEQAFGALKIERLDGYGIEDHAFWRMSVSCAHASEEIARAAGLDEGIMYIVGMLLDIGKLALEACLGDRMVSIGGRPDQLEREATGFNHEEIGAQIATAWNLSEPIPTCIRYHHDPADARCLEAEVACAHLASWAVHWLGIPTGFDGMLYDLDTRVLDALGLSEGSVEEIALAVLEGIQSTEEPTPTPIS
ncbi:MAG TPA: HDOD domain-containing protein [Deltaproteobacteria bacterium]|nr:HDOD domain-containing protein [Deltaproteobacteria bacterium]